MFERGKTNMNRRYRKTIIAGNWKMNKTPAEAKALIEEMKPLLSKTKWCEMVLCVPFTDIQAAVKAAKGSKIAIGAENMHFEKSGAFTGEISADMLKELGKTNKPILLKRGLAGTIKELLMSAEYIMANGNENVILCERGIRTYESTYTRNTLDLSVVPVLKGLTHLPVVVDPSHGTGHAYLVEPMAMAAAAAGADGIMIEVHNDPPHALCDGAQSLTPEQFAQTARKIFRIREAMQE